MRVVAPVLVLALLALLAAAAEADRGATPHERKAVAKVVKVPTACAKVRVSTISTEREWAKVRWRPRPGCSDYARNGVAVLAHMGSGWQRELRHWTHPDCLTLFKTAPGQVVLDLFPRRCS
jgi:hypothetical protein